MSTESKNDCSCLADLQNRALVRYTLACQVIMDLAAHAAHARVFLKSGRRLPRFLVFVGMIKIVLYIPNKQVTSFFIAPTCAKMIEDEEIRSFFEFLITNNPADNYTSELDSYVTYAKKNMQWRMEFMTWERMETYKYEEGFEDGEQNGRQNKAIEDATNLIKEKISPEIIARCVGLPLEQVQKLAEEIELPGA